MPQGILSAKKRWTATWGRHRSVLLSTCWSWILDKAEKKIGTIAQRQSFLDDESTLKGRIARLKPFEEDGILLVEGRLKHSDLQYDAKHPMILPEKHPISQLIIRHYHHLNGHVGTYQVLVRYSNDFGL